MPFLAIFVEALDFQSLFANEKAAQDSRVYVESCVVASQRGAKRRSWKRPRGLSKFLGIWLDRKRNFQGMYIVVKGTLSWLDKCQQNILRYPLDSDLSGG